MEQIKKFMEECTDVGVDYLTLTQYDENVLLGMIKKYGEDMFDGGYEEAQDEFNPLVA